VKVSVHVLGPGEEAVFDLDGMPGGRVRIEMLEAPLELPEGFGSEPFSDVLIVVSHDRKKVGAWGRKNKEVS
jgi:hypothetical protein